MYCSGVQSSTMAYSYCGDCASCWRTIGCIGCTVDGFICRWSSLTPCTMRGWHCSRSAFSCSTSSRILPCVLSDEMWSLHTDRCTLRTRHHVNDAEVSALSNTLRNNRAAFTQGTERYFFITFFMHSILPSLLIQSILHLSSSQ